MIVFNFCFPPFWGGGDKGGFILPCAIHATSFFLLTLSLFCQKEKPAKLIAGCFVVNEKSKIDENITDSFQLPRLTNPDDFVVRDKPGKNSNFNIRISRFNPPRILDLSASQEN